MTYKEICDFLLTGYIDVCFCDTREFDGKENLGEIFPDLCDSPDSVAPGKYFYFFSDNESKDFDLEKCLQLTTDKVAAYELPTKDGWYFLFRIDE